MKPTPQDLAIISQLADREAGIQWDDSKIYLIESRLKPLLEKLKCASYAELVSLVRRDSNARTHFIDAITTRETLFFRDGGPFRTLEEVIFPEYARQSSSRRIRIWSAACSSGQEAYSMGISFLRAFPSQSRQVEILATDLSPAAIEKAKRGVFSDFEIGRGLDPMIRDRYFQRNGSSWEICDDVKRLVRFQERNLLKPFTDLGTFDIIFCRNVAIYFDIPVKRDLFERLSRCLTPEGTIFVGSSESLVGYGERWSPQYHERSVYYRPNLTHSVV